MDRFFVETKSKSKESQIISGEGFRISVLTPYLLRVERGETCDEATQSVWYRAWDEPSFKVEKDGKIWRIVTEKTTFFFDVKAKKIIKIK